MSATSHVIQVGQEGVFKKNQLSPWNDEEPEDEEGHGGGKGTPSNKKSKGKGKGKGSDTAEPDEGDGEGSKGKDGEEDESGGGDEHGEGEGESASDADWDEIDQQSKEIEKMMEDSKEASKEDLDKELQNQAEKKTKQNSKPGKDKGTPSAFDYSNIQPKFNWRGIIKQFVKTADAGTEETYKKPSRSSATRVSIAAQLGAAAIKPGEEQIEDNLKLCIVTDNSGSMDHIIPKVYAEINSLLRQAQKATSDLFLIKFSDKFYIYKINFSKGTTSHLSKVSDKSKEKHNDLKTVFTRTLSGGTIFSVHLANEILELKDYNILIFTDSDITATSNFENFMKVNHHFRNQCFAIFDNKTTFDTVNKLTHRNNLTFTYFDD